LSDLLELAQERDAALAKTRAARLVWSVTPNATRDQNCRY